MVAASSKNLWVAASDGDIERVKSLIEAGATPNDPDAHSYTPMHAAASYAHLELLEYLLSAGGNVNVTDGDGDTPLFTCETLPAARWLVEHGADVGHRNGEGETAAEALEEDHPEVSAYLRSLDPNAPTSNANVGDTSGDVSQLAIDTFTNDQTNALMEDARRVMEQAERDGTDPEEALKELVQKAVEQGLSFAGEAGAGAGAATEDGAAGKRLREE